jgi:DNA-binding response OmpR family regulator
MDAQIMRLRRKLEKVAATPSYINTERGAGYIFGVPPANIY